MQDFRRVELLIGLALFLAGVATVRGDEPQVVESPGHQVRFTLTGGDRLQFSLQSRGSTVVEPSPLAFTLDGVDLATGAEVGGNVEGEARESYSTRGAHSTAHSHYRYRRISLVHRASRTPFTLEVRVFDDGAAFRTIVPGEGKTRTPDETTTFRLPAGSTVWYHDLRGHYEAEYKRSSAAEVPAGAWAGVPLTYKLPNGAGYASITEADLRNYSGFALQADGKRGYGMRLGHAQPVSYPFELRYGAEEGKRLAVPAAVAGTITTPWRLVMVSPDLNGLVNSDAVRNLCPAPDPALFPKGLATEWVQPGRAVWEYLDGKAGTPEGMREYCRIAGELGFEHNVLEGFWRRWTDAGSGNSPTTDGSETSASGSGSTPGNSAIRRRAGRSSRSATTSESRGSRSISSTTRRRRSSISTRRS